MKVYPVISRRFRLLMVDADANRVAALISRLAQPTFRWRTATDAHSGLEEFEQFHPHLMVLHHDLPDGDGTELCRSIRGISLAPLIMLGIVSEFGQLNALRAGADDILHPLSIPVLKARIAAHLRRVYRYDGLAHDRPLRAGFRGPGNSPVPVSAARVDATAARADATHAGTPATPPGSPLQGFGWTSAWVRCDSCRYLGPQEKFETRDHRGEVVAACPCCHAKKSLVFAVG